MNLLGCYGTVDACKWYIEFVWKYTILNIPHNRFLNHWFSKHFDYEISNDSWFNISAQDDDYIYCSNIDWKTFSFFRYICLDIWTTCLEIENTLMIAKFQRLHIASMNSLFIWNHVINFLEQTSIQITTKMGTTKKLTTGVVLTTGTKMFTDSFTTQSILTNSTTFVGQTSEMCFTFQNFR